MGMTITEKIFAAHSGKNMVHPGEIVIAELDLVFAHELSGMLAMDIFEKRGFTSIKYPEKIVLLSDHFTPAKDIRSAEMTKRLRDFARKMDLKQYHEVGRGGICHVLIPDEGYVKPGALAIGGDSHTSTWGALGAVACGVGSTDLVAAWMTGELWFRVPEQMKFVYTGKLNDYVCGKDLILETIRRVGVEGCRYRTAELAGPVIETLPMNDRFTMCNMTVEMGAKNGIIAVDETTEKYLAGRIKGKYPKLESDSDAKYVEIIEIDISNIEPVVAAPYLPSNVSPAREFANVEIHQVIIGSCTNGRAEDLKAAADILKGRKAHDNVRCIVLPGSQDVVRAIIADGTLDTLIKAGCAVSTPTCGPCIGGHMGVIAAGERCVSTTNRNFRGRMGAPESEVYLASPAVAAASAVTGHITDPRDLD
ncbi:MAG: 3-isopropylmalate dehydratase large subunit [Planctomycetota bacterium]|jgi:3-isopropylmalate/(R)-2-methylmalate dehydratase large subunit